MYQSFLKSAVCNLFSYDGLTVRNVQNWEAWHRLSSGKLRYQADRNTGGWIVWTVPKWRSNFTTLLKSVEVPKLTDAHYKQKVQYVRNNLFRKFCWARSKVIQLHKTSLTYNSKCGILLTKYSKTDICGNNVLYCTVLYLPLRWWMLHLKQDANSVSLAVPSCGNFVH